MGHEADETSAIVEHAGPVGFDATLARLTAAIEHAGLTIFAKIDHVRQARATPASKCHRRRC